MKIFGKRMTVLSLTALAVVAAVITAGCGSTPKAPKQKTELLDWKGAGFNTPVPQWVIQSQESGVHIQSLDEFKDQYCFVVWLDNLANNESRDMLIAWVSNTANGAAEVATMVSTTVSNGATADDAIKSGDANVKRRTEEFAKAMSNANFRELRKAGDFWTLSRNRATKNEYNTAYSLLIIPEESLNTQVAALWQNFIDNNEAMSAAERTIYGDIITNLRTRLLGKVN
jgi:hypothetical protein